MYQLEPLTFEAYQAKAYEVAVYPEVGEASLLARVYCAFGLSGESGEVAEKIKKILRDKGGEFSADDIVELAKELGDILWYISALCGELGLSLEDVAAGNLDKLFSRRDRGVLQGSGDNR